MALFLRAGLRALRPRGTSDGLGRTLRLKVGPLAMALVAVGIAWWALGPGDLGEPSLVVTDTGTGVAVQIIGTAATPAQLTRQLRTAGLDVAVTTVGVNDQLVGSWVAAEGLPDTVTAQVAGYPQVLLLPRGRSGGTLTMGVAPEAGRAPDLIALRNAFAPGALLECSSARGAPAERAAADLGAAGWRVTFVDVADASAPARPAADDVVTMAFLSDDAVGRDPAPLVLAVVAADDPRLQRQLGSGFAADGRNVPPCRIGDG